MINGASNIAESFDFAFYFVAAISIFFLLLITLLMLFFLIRYSNRRHPNPTVIRGNLKLEIFWTVIPTLLVIAMFFIGLKGYVDAFTLPEDAMEVDVQGQMWFWSFQYKNGVVSPELYLPQGEKVRLNLKSNDVIHSFYVPAMRIKRDLVPGMKSTVWFVPEKPGDYEILCAEYCGTRHSYMISRLHVIPRKEFDQWLARKQSEAE